MKKWAIIALVFVNAINGFALAQNAKQKSKPKAEPKKERTAEEIDKREGVKWGGYPIFSFSSDEGLTLGALARRFDYGVPGRPPFDNLVTFQGTFATEGRKTLGLAFEKSNTGIWDMRWEASLFGQIHDRVPYYGVGDDLSIVSTGISGFYAYSQKGIGIANKFRKPIVADWEVFAGISLSLNRLEANSSSTKFFQDFGGEADDLFMTVFSAGVLLEQRDNEFIPEKGFFFSWGWSASPSLISSEDTWWSHLTDFRVYQPLIRDRWLGLAFQTRFAMNSASTPFISKVKVGSASTIRGYRSNRFVANYLFTARAELRSTVIRWRVFNLPLKAGAGFFFDSGKIGDNFARLFSNRYLYAFGLTFFASYFTDDFLGHADFAWSNEEGPLLYLSLGHSF